MLLQSFFWGSIKTRKLFLEVNFSTFLPEYSFFFCPKEIRQREKLSWVGEIWVNPGGWISLSYERCTLKPERDKTSEILQWFSLTLSVFAPFSRYLAAYKLTTHCSYPALIHFSVLTCFSVLRFSVGTVHFFLLFPPLLCFSVCVPVSRVFLVVHFTPSLQTYLFPVFF